jgi:hypothetical protein
MPPDHEVRLRCEKCGETGSFIVAELLLKFGDDVTLEAIREHFESQRCCGQPVKVDAGVH